MTLTITDKRWREVILLSVGMAREADDLLLLMKREIDSLLEGDEKLRSFLAWADEKSRSVNVSYKLVAVRAYYCARARRSHFAPISDLSLSRDLDLSLSRAINRTLSRAFNRALDSAFKRDFDSDSDLLDFDSDLDSDLDLALDHALARPLDNNRDFTLDRAIDFAKEIGGERLYQYLQVLKDRFPDSNRDRNAFKEWWKQNGKEWIAEYRQVLIEHRNICHDWQFTEEQREKLNQYYEANKLLVECLKSDCYVRRETRQEIEESLLLPSKR